MGESWKGVAIPKRLQMLRFVSQSETSAGDLTKNVPLDQSASSQHLEAARGQPHRNAT
ncbi:ArsR family transcriptional regulator [Agrobacterium vitis]|uniref:ArsR family transcriptional regulator n=1 Tax=Agrobacterium vitis TaxID=373 RepID=A0A368NLI2_AGRVI|nr:ArsR family transcriptional regulator [Agrobacterium vitis]KAA3506396.1 ArsR family transcriptional regulator [Agrobacterium vitis]KAA3520767.1 ArsR family transcriptional regulator [Agrobacterium vitis]MBF2714205.1 ArsR family transcriptional regulator [Agrobacterium vitis]MUO82383.1 ArsR family transcriptional regulator [Agrobacterium vitis]MUO95770.1 ArsR family transcriptional regulator [Agrobacterium vitis]